MRTDLSHLPPSTPEEIRTMARLTSEAIPVIGRGMSTINTARMSGQSFLISCRHVSSKRTPSPSRQV